MPDTKLLIAVLLAVVSVTPLSAADPVPEPRIVRAKIDTRPIVYVVDGAGDYRGCSTALTKAMFAEGNPVELSAVSWSHGYRKLLLDQVDVVHARRQGIKLAETIREEKSRESDRRIVVVAHSAGAAVALAAAEQLDSSSIDRLILLAPSVSNGYDLRPAMAACREGIDVFCSNRDRWALGVAMRLVGTTDDRRSRKAAGRLGFEVPSTDELSQQIRQRFWTPEDKADGHDGGHYGAYSPNYVRRYILPLLMGEKE
ncbi:alpha/beta fold hydrolase [Limnoglobus roseus]|uniref:Alpha/beta hydrolase n=1 Tax=Limnoglobus roseus TaxID=2598579 RepID=A0A5C1AR36_9BACT|nr:alpha/beta fold hydrolase [Limnoglobus roseus]QEL19664.1 alpha/beta hydrolase [Limnoglobus roseus]